MAERIQLVFSGATGPTLKMGPFASFCLQGETMREAIGAPAFAVHREHQWRIDHQSYSRVDCDCRVKMHLTRVDGLASQDYGPFESFSCMDGVAYANHELFAFADRSIGDWYCHADGRHWAIIVVEAVG